MAWVLVVVVAFLFMVLRVDEDHGGIGKDVW